MALASGDASGEQLSSWIGEGILQILTEKAGARPGAARVTVEDDVVVCVLEEALLPLERTLRDRGKIEQAWLHRTAMGDALRAVCAELVAALTGREVVATASGVEVERELVVETFVLGAGGEGPALGDQGEAMTNWSRQTRRRAGALRARHRELLAEHGRLACHRPESEPGSVTTDHATIRRWADAHAAHPARLRGDRGLALELPGRRGAEQLERITWKEWLERFDAQALALRHSEPEPGGQGPVYYELVSR